MPTKWLRCMNETRNKFFQLLRFAVGASSQPPEIEREEYASIYALANKQAVTGIAFDGIARIGKDAKIDPTLLLRWLSLSKQIEKQNCRLNKAAVGVSDYFAKKGFKTCILKGQGNALMYPQPLHRTPGDIDIWVSGTPSETIRFVHSVSPSEKSSYHHIDFPAYKGIEVEVHYRPCYLQNFLHNTRLQRYFQKHVQEQFSHCVQTQEGDFAAPTAEFNAVYQLVHIYNHLFQEGIGLRQIMDYYFVMQNVEYSLRETLQRDLLHLGLWHFAGAVMYVLREVLDLQEDKMIAPVDERRGRLLLEEIMQGGNFGQHDERRTLGRGAIGHNIQRLVRDLRLVRFYPSEALSEPLFRLWHWCWRKVH